MTLFGGVIRPLLPAPTSARCCCHRADHSPARRRSFRRRTPGPSGCPRRARGCWTPAARHRPGGTPGPRRRSGRRRRPRRTRSGCALTTSSLAAHVVISSIRRRVASRRARRERLSASATSARCTAFGSGNGSRSFIAGHTSCRAVSEDLPAPTRSIAPTTDDSPWSPTSRSSSPSWRSPARDHGRPDRRSSAAIASVVRFGQPSRAKGAGPGSTGVRVRETGHPFRSPMPFPTRYAGRLASRHPNRLASRYRDAIASVPPTARQGCAGPGPARSGHGSC